MMRGRAMSQVYHTHKIVYRTLWIIGSWAALAAVSANAGDRGGAVRVAVVAGANVGVGDDTPLRFAESDAARVGAVLKELGRHTSGRVRILRAATPGTVLRALAKAGRVVRALKAARREVVFTFYYSGHATPGELRLSGGVLPLAELKRRLRLVPADVRIVVVDACHSGSFAALARKGGRPAPPFRIRFVDELAAKGEVFIASSAPHEAAQESTSLQGSFFTSHLVSGLRGAADQNGDAVVTLSEAYQYAYAQTVRSTALSHAGLQHPRYQYDVRGTRDLALSWPGGAESHLTLRARTAGPFLVFSAGGQTLYAEVPVEPGDTPRIALPAGDYAVQKRTASGLLSAMVSLAKGRGAALEESSMTATAFEITSSRGAELARHRGGAPTFYGLGLDLRLSPVLAPGFGGGYLDTARTFGFAADGIGAVELYAGWDRARWWAVYAGAGYGRTSATRRLDTFVASTHRVLLDVRFVPYSSYLLRLSVGAGFGAYRAATSLAGIDSSAWTGGVRAGFWATFYVWRALGLAFGYHYARVNALVRDSLSRGFEVGGHEVTLLGLSVRL